jgi:hypothetical protein
MAVTNRNPEPFVSAEGAATYLGITRRMLLAMARMGVPGAYAVGTGNVRKHWIFRISELTTAAAPACAAKGRI